MRHPGVRGRMHAALDAGRRWLWVSAPVLSHDEFIDDLRDLVGAGLSTVSPAGSASVFDAASDVVVAEPDRVDPVLLSALVDAAPRTLVVLAPTGADRGAATFFDAVTGAGETIAPEPADGPAWEAHVATSAGIDAEATARVLAQGGDVAPWIDALVADLIEIDIEAPGEAARVAGDLRGPAITACLDRAKRLIGPDALVAAERLAVDPDTSIDATSIAELDRVGWLTAAGRLVPAAADALLAVLSAGRRSELADEALAAAEHAGAVATAHALDRLGRDDHAAAALRRVAAAEVVDRDPSTALRWAGDDSAGAETRLRALVGVGRMSDALGLADRVGGDFGAAVTAAALAHAARLKAAGAAYGALDGPTGRLGHVALVVAGHAGDEPTPGAEGLTGLAVDAFVEGIAAAPAVPDRSVDGLVQAAEHAVDVDAALWPDGPSVAGALVASMLFRHDLAIELLDRAVAAGVGGAVHQRRLVLTRGWVALRAGRWAEADDALESVREVDLSLRDQLAAAALDVALCHRRGDAGALDAAVAAAVPLVRRHPVDLLSLFAHGEIAIGAAKLGHVDDARRLLDQLADATGEHDAVWQVTVAWLRRVARLASGLRFDAVDAPAGFDALDEAVALAADPAGADASALDAVGRALLDRGQVLEASLLAGAVALEADETTAKPALRLAREFRGRLPRGIADESSGIGALSDRELEVARELVDGFTYKEIGGRLFISPKTVEHHVAHIRTKLGAGSRAEMLAALRSGLG